MELTRRDFLRAGGSVFGSAAVPGLPGTPLPKQGEGKVPVEFNFAEEQTRANRIWMTPKLVTEDGIATPSSHLNTSYGTTKTRRRSRRRPWNRRSGC